MVGWWLQPEFKFQDTQDTKTVWTGTTPYTKSKGQSLALYKYTWKNPLPDVEIDTIDFVSEMTDAAPFLVAITVE